MEEHEKLKAICDKIGYEFWDMKYELDQWYYKQIIFTQEFMDKFLLIRKDWKLKTIPCLSLKWTFYEWLMENLDDPVPYLYNLILWNNLKK